MWGDISGFFKQINMKRCFFALGGGSDFYSAWLLAFDSDSLIITAFAPVMQDMTISIEQTVNKYTGRPYCSSGHDCKVSRDVEYTVFSLLESNTDWPIFVDSRRENSFGVLIPKGIFVPETLASKAAIQLLLGGRPHEIIAVDTGGDSLRGLVDGMGNRDVSGLYDGIVDSRDSDSIEIIKDITGGAFTLYVFGLGSDGETSDEGVSQALNCLERNASPGLQLLHVGSMSVFTDQMSAIHKWREPLESSTLRNIRRAMEFSDDSLVEIRRRGTVTNSIKTKYVSSYWVIRVSAGTVT